MTAVPAARATRATPWIIFSVFLIATLFRGTGLFLYDAENYWNAAQALLHDGHVTPLGFFDTRGIFTAMVYAPSAVFGALFGEQYGPFAVALQNSAFLAWTAAFVLPALVRKWAPIDTSTRVVGAVAVWVATAAFAPYPLIDIYAAVGVIAVLVLVSSPRWWVLLVAGIAAGAVVNLRPAYLLPVFLLLVVVLLWRRVRGLFVVLGMAASFLPQLVLNRWFYTVWSVFPPGTAALAGLQSSYASYVIRYDTIFGEPNARQFYCSPDMAKAVVNSLPKNTWDLLLAFVHNPSISILFGLEKLGSSLYWPASTPYTKYSPGLDLVFALCIIFVVVVGLVAISFAVTRVDEATGKRNWYSISAIGAVVLGSVITLIGSATESRFALLLVLLGCAGCAILLPRLRSGLPRIRRPRLLLNAWTVSAAVLLIAMLVLGHAGISHPAPRGEANARTCSTT